LADYSEQMDQLKTTIASRANPSIKAEQSVAPKEDKQSDKDGV